MSSYIYVMRSREHCKVGYSINPTLRRNAVEVEVGRPVDLIAAIECLDAEGSERRAHSELAEHRRFGEWFEIDPERAVRVAKWASKNPVTFTSSPKVMRFSQSELLLLEQAKERHGSYIAGVIAALNRVALAEEESVSELTARALRRRADQIERDD